MQQRVREWVRYAGKLKSARRGEGSFKGGAFDVRILGGLVNGLVTPGEHQIQTVQRDFQMGIITLLPLSAEGRYFLMRIWLASLVGVCLAVSSSSVTTARAQTGFPAGLQVASVADFYTPLSAYGPWVDVPQYGKCWHPASVPPDWRPYTNGSWEWTDAGWYWASDEPRAWACYHYGTWLFDNSYGWLWVPGTEWAPAWVAWREGPDYIGWAPCTFENTVVAPSLFVFVDIHRFHHRIRPDLLVVNDPKIIERTRFTRNFKRERRNFDGVDRTVVVAPGPSLEPIQKATGTNFTPEPIANAISRTPIPQGFRRSNTTETPLAPTGRGQPQATPSTPQTAPPPTVPQTAPPTVPQTPPPTEFPNPQPRREIPVPPTQREPALNPPIPQQRRVVPPPQQRPPPPTEPQRRPDGQQSG